MKKRVTLAVGAFAMSLNLLTAGPADAVESTVSWERSCGHEYYGVTNPTKVSTEKSGKGSCDGHAWVRGQRTDGTWTNWQHASGKVTIRSESAIRYKGAEHKGCSTCKEYETVR
jgi:hypothetical protein